ncbi:MAG TPA: insulinase family protein, partial [Longimicrobiales bacterium]|nr:insulinase family protein [Longimicrobiales bacterium]
AVPTEAQLLAIAEAVRTKAIEPYQDVAVTVPLIARLPEPAAITEERTIEELGITEWRLANGVRVVLKPTDFQTDQVLLSGTSPGGTSLTPDSLYVQAMFASTAAQVGGVGEHSMQDLRKVLTGKTASANALIGQRTEAVSGASSRKDIETMLQLVYLRFTAPRLDEPAFAAFKQANQAMLANRAASPQTAFFDTISVTMAQHHPRARPVTAQLFDEIDLERALAIYRDRFADASDFTFFIVGDFDVDSIRPHVQRYLGGLPSLGRVEEGRDVGVRPPTGVVNKVVRAGAEPQSQTFMSFTGPFQFDKGERYLLTSLGDLLENRLLEKLRESLGGTYSVNVSAGAGRDEPATYTATISFGSAPDRADELAATVLEEIRALQAEGPTAAEVDKIREAQRRARELSLKQNNFWISSISSAYQYGDDPRDILTEDQRFDTLTAEAIRATAQKYLRLDNYVHITLLPATPRS